MTPDTDSTTPSPAHPWANPDLPPDLRVADLLARLTLGEKVAQLSFDSPAIPRLGIPAYNWWNECLHGLGRSGVATVFPQVIALAATFDPDTIHAVGAAVAAEGRARHHAHAERGDRGIYKGLTYWSPNINIVRDPRWGRAQETYGECPWLTGTLGTAFVRGIQGDDRDHLKGTACAKHFAAHSGPETGRHGFDSRVDGRDLRETYLPAFRMLVREGRVEAVMGAYNRLNGQPCCADPRLLNDILRGEWGFRGHVVSDCGAISDIHGGHGVTASPMESAAMAVRAGLDLCCGADFCHLMDAVGTGLLDEADVDRALARLLDVRVRLGLLDPPEHGARRALPVDVIDSPPHRALGLAAARRGIVLLKNDGLLPLRRDAVRSIAVIGPNAAEVRALLGNYHATPSSCVTPLDGIRAAAAPGCRVTYAQGSDHFGGAPGHIGTDDRMIVEAAIAAERADVVVLCLGLSPAFEGEEGDAFNAEAGGDRARIELPDVQEHLLRAMAATGRPVVLVLMGGSAIAVPWAQRNVPAILHAFYPGQDGGTALAEILFGDVSPSGRMPFTTCASTSDLPPFTDYAMEGRTYRFFRGEPLYPFGFGLGYARFAYDDLIVEPAAPRAGEPFTVRATVRNVEGPAAEEVAQLYLARVDAPVRAPVRQLAGVARVRLGAGEKREVVFRVDPRSLALYRDDGAAFVPPGGVRVSVGGGQPDAVSLRLGAPVPVETVVRLEGAEVALEP